MIIITITGNLVIILSVCLVRKLRTASNILIVSLAVSDVLVGLIIMPLAMGKSISRTRLLLNASCFPSARTCRRQLDARLDHVRHMDVHRCFAVHVVDLELSDYFHRPLLHYQSSVQIRAHAQSQVAFADDRRRVDLKCAGFLAADLGLGPYVSAGRASGAQTLHKLSFSRFRSVRKSAEMSSEHQIRIPNLRHDGFLLHSPHCCTNHICKYLSNGANSHG